MSQIYQPSADEYLLYNPEFIKHPEEFQVSMKALTDESAKSRQRGQATFFDYADMPLVLKHYYRGGMMANLSRDKYLWTGRSRTRVVKEWQLLETMNVLNLPVPVPVAAKIKRQGIFYRADLITQCIPNATPFGEMLKNNSADNSVWTSLGQLIQSFQRHGVYHADLNANNILITDSRKLYLIDFDKSRLRMKEPGWMNKMLTRLKRSFYKIKDNNPDYHFTEENWTLLREGYMR